MLVAPVMEDPADDQAMMEAMGFSSFGMQKPANKKRKYNPHADASFEKTKKTVQSSTGANSMPLGTPAQRQPCPAQPPANTGEISLDDDDEDKEEGAETLNTTGSVPIAQPDAGGSTPKALPAHLVGLPARPANVAGSGSAPQHGNQNHGRAEKGGHNPIWYEGYYDHRSNENPWAALEKQHGLQPLGTWPSNATTTTT